MRKVKNPHDVRFMRSAKKLRHTINQSYRRHVANLRIRCLTRQAGVSKSAFYDHYSDINDAIRHIEHDLIHDFRHQLKALTPHQPTKHALYTRLLLFIHHNYEDFDAATERQNYGLIVNLLSELHPLVARDWPHYQPATYQQLFYLYAGEATFIIVNWIKQTKCDRDTISTCVGQLVTVERTIPHRFRELGVVHYTDTTIPEVAKLLKKINSTKAKS